MPPVGFEPTISAGERPQSYALDRAANGIGVQKSIEYICLLLFDFLSLQLIVVVFFTAR